MARLLVSSALATVIWSVTSGYFRLERIQVNSCPPAERASLESFVRNRIHCTAICEMERPCQGFCYNNVLKKCRTYRILLADANLIAVDDIGYSMYWSAYDGKTRFGRSLYYLKSDPGDFNGATTACGNDQAKVATPTDAAENEFIRSLSPPDLDIWIGINQLPGDGDWINQVTGQAISYSNWGGGEGQGSNDEDCAVINAALVWIDMECPREYYYVCQIPIEGQP